MSNRTFPSSLPGAVLTKREPVGNDILIDESISGRETRSTWSTYPRYRYEFQFNSLRSASAYAEYQKLLGFRSRHRGQLDSFLLTDPEDNAVTAMPFGVGDASTTSFQLQRTAVASADLNLAVSRAYWPTMGDGYEPVFDLNGNPSIFVDTGGGPVLKTLGVDYTLPGNGAVTFTAAPALNAIVTWTGSYYRRVRFESPTQPTGRVVGGIWTATVSLISVKPLESLPQTVPPQVVIIPYETVLNSALFTSTNGTDGVAAFALPRAPNTSYPIIVFKSGVKLTQGSDFSVSGSTLTFFNGSHPLADRGDGQPDLVTVEYNA